MQRTSWSPEQRLLTVGLASMVTAVAFEGMAVPTVLPDTLADLGGLAWYGWAFSGFWLANLVGITLAGAESDHAGPIGPFILGTAGFALGLGVAALAPSMEVVVLGRIIQGLGAGAISAVIYVAVARGYDAAAQPRMIAVISSAWVVPGLVGPLIAGTIAEQSTWRWVFGGLAPLLPLAAVPVVVSLRGLPRPMAAGAGARLGAARDALLLALGSGLALSALSVGHPVLGLVLAVVGIIALHPPLRRLLPEGTLSARPGRGAAVAALALISIAFLGAEAFVPLAVSSVRNAGVVAGGLALTAAAVTWATGSWVQARLAGRGARRSLVAAAFSLVLVGIAVVTTVPLTSVPIWVASAAWAVAGLGMGLGYSTLTLMTIESASPGAEGAAAAAVQLGNTLGIAAGTGIAGGIVSLVARGPGLAPAIGLANLVMIVACGVGLVITRRLPVRGAVGALPSAVGEHGPAL